jgi:hypothetical protein
MTINQTVIIRTSQSIRRNVDIMVIMLFMAFLQAITGISCDQIKRDKGVTFILKIPVVNKNINR